MPHRSWDVTAATDPDEGEQMTFTIGTETFQCVLPIPPAAAVAKIGRMAFTPTQDCIEFIEGILVEKDVPAFRALLASKDPIVPGGVLGEVMNWVIEEYGRRPFSLSSTSAPSPPNGQVSSAAGSSSPASG